MATNAPYYQQLRGQYTNSTNAALSSGHDEYDLAGPLTSHHASFCAGTPTDSVPIALEDNHNLVELLEAATTAAGQATQAMNLNMSDANTNKRKRTPSPPPEDMRAGGESDAPPVHKRARMDISTDPRLDETGHRSHAQNGASLSPTPATLLNDARAAGVHSAAALFRRPVKEPTRKYTRPPMSKLFMSLQLTPENFLHLQSQAKAYMLDPAHPERQSCVGNRGKGDTDMVKLKLFNCVREFLSSGVGDDFFGEHVEKPAAKDKLEAAKALGQESAATDEPKLVWPRDGNTIISLVTPLLRRMVTNERQRLYAIDTRKGGAKKKDGSVGSPTVQENEGSGEGTIAQTRELQSPFQGSHPTSLHTRATSHPPAPLSSTVHHFPIAKQHASPNLSPPTQSIINISGPPIAFANTTMVLPPLVSAGPAEQLKPRIQQTFLPLVPMPELRQIDILISKNGRQLKPQEIIINPNALKNLSWEELQNKIDYLIRDAMEIYPQLRPLYLRHVPQDRILDNFKGMASAPLPETLRSLAAAVNNENTDLNFVDIPTLPRTMPSADDGPTLAGYYMGQTASPAANKKPGVPIPTPEPETPVKKMDSSKNGDPLGWHLKQFAQTASLAAVSASTPVAPKTSTSADIHKKMDSSKNGDPLIAMNGNKSGKKHVHSHVHFPNGDATNDVDASNGVDASNDADDLKYADASIDAEQSPTVHDDTPDDEEDDHDIDDDQHGTPGDGKSSANKRQRTCDSCRGLTVKCIQETSDQGCARCKKANRQCITTPPPRRRQKKADSRVAELDENSTTSTAVGSPEPKPAPPRVKEVEETQTSPQGDEPKFPSLLTGPPPSEVGRRSKFTVPLAEIDDYLSGKLEPKPVDAQLPHVVKVMMTNGLTQIKNEKEWKAAIEDVSNAVWAQGKMTVVVDLGFDY